MRKNYGKCLGLVLLCAVWQVQAAEVAVGGVLEEETRVYLGNCFFEDPAKAAPVPIPPTERLGPKMAWGAVGVAAAEAVIDFGVGALKAAAEEKTAQAIAAYPANGWMYQHDTSGNLLVHPESKCIQVISGSFWNGLRMQRGEDDAKAVTPRDERIHVPLDARAIDKTQDPGGDEVSVARWDAGGPLFGKLKGRYRQLRWARFFFEARIEKFKGTEDKFVVAPSALYFEKAVEKSFFELGKGKRNLLVTISLAKAGADAGTTFASVSFPFRDVLPGTLLTPLYFQGHTSRALQAPDLSEEDKKVVLARDALLKQASVEVALAAGQPQPATFESPLSLDSPEYRKAVTAYCNEVKAYNTEIAKNKRAMPAAATECPVETQVARLNLEKANKAFNDHTRRLEAAFNTQNRWTKGGNADVGCSPTLPGKDFKTGCGLSKAVDAGPMTVSATVVEVKEASKFVAFLGKVAEKVQPVLNTALEARLPEKKAEAVEDGKQADEAYAIAMAEVSVAEAALAAKLADAKATEEEKASQRKVLLEKKVAANRAARKAGKPEPFALGL